jgi:hypothetical protein
VPADVPVVVAMKNMGQFYGSLNSFASTLHLPKDAMGKLSKGADLLKTPGLSADGSAALAVLSMEGDQEKGPVVMVVPVKDFASFAKALGGKGEGVDEVKLENETAYLKDLGGGWAALGPVKELVEKFSGKGGSGKAFESLMGATGAAVAENSDAFMVANMEKVGPIMKDKAEEMQQNMEMMAAMAGGQQNQGNLEIMKAATDAFFRDASASVVGLKAAESGVKLDLAAQFKEGSDSAKLFNAKGKASDLTASLPKPADGFYFAAAMDASSPGLKQLFKNMMEMSKKDPEAAKLVSGLNPIQQIEKIDGMAFCMGQSPAMLSGLFLNTSAFVKTADPKGYVSSMKDAMTKLNGQSMQGITYQTSFQPGGGKVGDTAVDMWSLKMNIDPNSPNAQQMAGIQTALFGPGGLKGFIVPVENGVVITYSTMSDTLKAALEAAKGGKGLNEDPGVKNVQANLPAGRTAELFIGVRSLLEAFQSFAPMFGGGGGNAAIPADLPPIGIGGTTSTGGLRATVFVPTQVITTIQGFAKAMNGQGEGEEQPEMDAPKKQDKTGQPKF